MRDAGCAGRTGRKKKRQHFSEEVRVKLEEAYQQLDPDAKYGPEAKAIAQENRLSEEKVKWVAATECPVASLTRARQEMVRQPAPVRATPAQAEPKEEARGQVAQRDRQELADQVAAPIAAEVAARASCRGGPTAGHAPDDGQRAAPAAAAAAAPAAAPAAGAAASARAERLRVRRRRVGLGP